MPDPVYTGVIAQLDRLQAELESLALADPVHFGQGELDAASDWIRELRQVVAGVTEPARHEPAPAASSDVSVSLTAIS